MIKKRSFWTGIGIGIAAGAVLLQMMMIGSTGAASKEEAGQIDIETLKQQAESLGYHVYASDEQWFSKAELETYAAEAQEEALRNTEPEIITSMERSIYVMPGMSLNQVADLLLSLSLIEDKQLFIEKMKDQKLQGKIQTGVTTFIDEPSLDEIITRLTEK